MLLVVIYNSEIDLAMVDTLCAAKVECIKKYCNVFNDLQFYVFIIKIERFESKISIASNSK